MEIAERLKLIMDYFGLTPASFADRLEVQRSSISHLLSGRNKPSLDFVMKVLTTFPEVDLLWLVNGIGEFPLNENKSTEKIYTQFSANQNSLQQKLNFETENADINEPPTINNLVGGIHQTVKNENAVEQIVIFYKDGTFKNYSPKN